MELRFIAFALTLLLLIPGSVLSEEATRQSKVRAVQHAALMQQAAQRVQRCHDSAASAAMKTGAGAADEFARPQVATGAERNC